MSEQDFELTHIIDDNSRLIAKAVVSFESNTYTVVEFNIYYNKISNDSDVTGLLKSMRDNDECHNCGMQNISRHYDNLFDDIEEMAKDELRRLGYAWLVRGMKHF